MTAQVLHRLFAFSLDTLVRSMPFVLLTSSGVILVDAARHRWPSSGPERGGFVTTIALIVIAGTLPLHVVFAGWRRLPSALRNLPTGKARCLKSFALSLQLAILLLIPAAQLAVAKNPFPGVQWYPSGFVDKRWLFALCWIAVFGVWSRRLHAAVSLEAWVGPRDMHVGNRDGWHFTLDAFE